MRKSHRNLTGSAVRLAAFSILALALLVGTTQLSGISVEANHPVLVEGNCDSPIPGTTLVTTVGTCGDFDGDGRIGTAEDTDGADRIFGTINAALGPGTGAAAGTGANFNGRVLIVASGRFAESIFIGNNLCGAACGGIADPGNVTLEAAPGVSATIDAVLQGDPAGGNNVRQAGRGIQVTYTTNGASRVVILRNLTVRNFAIGIGADNNSRVHIDRCNLDSNIDYGIRLDDAARVVITNTQVTNTGFRIGSATSVPNPGHGFYAENNAQARIQDSVFTQNANGGIVNNTVGGAANIVLFKVGTYFNAVDIFGPVTVASGNSASAPESESDAPATSGAPTRW